MRDKVKLYKDFKVFKEKCHICLNQFHLTSECDKIRFLPNRDFLIKRHNHSAYQARGCPNQTNSTRKKIKVLSNLQSIQSNAINFTKTEEEPSISEFSLSEENENTPKNGLSPTNMAQAFNRNQDRNKTKVECPPVVLLKKPSEFLKLDDPPLLLKKDNSKNDEQKLFKKTSEYTKNDKNEVFNFEFTENVIKKKFLRLKF